MIIVERIVGSSPEDDKTCTYNLVLVHDSLEILNIQVMPTDMVL